MTAKNLSLVSAKNSSLDLDYLEENSFVYSQAQVSQHMDYEDEDEDEHWHEDSIARALEKERERETTLEVLHELTIYIRSQSAEATPPLGTVLGNLGVNSIKFCKEFNEFTQDLPSYITLGVSITVFENRSFSFVIISGPSIGHLLGLLRYEANIWEKNQYVVRTCINLKAVVQLTVYRFPQVPLRMSLPMVVASLNAAALTIIYESH